MYELSHYFVEESFKIYVFHVEGFDLFNVQKQLLEICIIPTFARTCIFPPFRLAHTNATPFVSAVTGCVGIVGCCVLSFLMS